MVYNDEGFLYPSRNESKCNNCEVCISTCPIINESKLKNKGRSTVYAAQNKDTDELIKSSSGGVFSVVARYVLERGGIVAGVAYGNGLNLKHVIISDAKELDRLRGSKYFAAENHNIYVEIKETLKKGQLVCFSGTGCQVAALKSFLHKDYDNLMTIDIVCHGTPSQKAFQYFLIEFEKKHNEKVVDWKFRDKTIEGWQCSSSSSSVDPKGNTIKHYFDKIFKAYFNAFISGDMYREGCYQCPFACPERSGDITLADYWGVEQFHKDIDSFNGVSAVLVNNPKGERVFEEIKANLIYRETKLEWVSKINQNLLHPTHRTKRRNTIYKELSNNPKQTINSYCSNKEYYISYIKHIIKKFLRHHISVYRFIYKIKKGLIQ